MVSAVASFLEGFNAGWDTTGKVGAAYKIGKLDEDEDRLKAGLTPNETTGKYSIFGMDFDESPDTYQVSEARNMAQAKIYDRWGDADMARGLRSDALSSRASGQTYRAGEQTFNQAEEMNPLLVEQAGLQNANLGKTGRGLDQTFNQNELMNPIAVNKAKAEVTNLGLAGDVTRQTIARANAADPIELEKLQLELAQAKKTSPLAVAEIKARIAQIKSTTTGSNLGNEAARAAINQAKGMDPLYKQKLEEDIARAAKMGDATLKQVNAAIAQADLTNPEALKLLKAQIEGVIANTAGTEADTKLKVATFDDLVKSQGAQTTSAIAASKFAVQALPAKIKEAFATADSAKIAAAYDNATFDDRLKQIKTDLGISEQFLNDAIASSPAKLQGLLDTNVLAAMKIDGSKLDLEQQQAVSDVNVAYKNALLKGDFTGVEQVLMPFAVDVYNGNNVEDDDNQAVRNEDGSFSIVGPDGAVLGSASEILQQLPMDQKRDILRQAQAYSISAITGDDSGVQELFKTEAWLTYYQAQSDALKKGKSLTKAQWAVQRFTANPQDKLAIAILAGDNSAEVFDQTSDPAWQLQNGIGAPAAGGNRPGELNGGNGNGDGDGTVPPPFDPKVGNSPGGLASGIAPPSAGGNTDSANSLEGKLISNTPPEGSGIRPREWERATRRVRERMLRGLSN